MLEDSTDYNSEWIAADGGALRVTKQGSVIINETAIGEPVNIRLLDVYYGGNLEKNTIYSEMLEARGFGIAYGGKLRVIAALSGIGGSRH
nr:AlNc14C314G10521 [Albugo laibachii Nc14]|eukprot:CCA25699.1 AlNc14C314G10521 [Albugo laibachii Nc14]